MDPSSQANFRKYQRQTIDAAIKSSGPSIRELRRRHNTLVPIFSLPTEIIIIIFFLSRIPRSSSSYIMGKKSERLTWLRVAHVCHQWREIALNHPLFWSHVDLTSLSPAGATEVLNRAKTAPLYLEAKFPFSLQIEARVPTLQKELQVRISHIGGLDITAMHLPLRTILEGLVSPAPTLEYLSLYSQGDRVSVPDTLFDGTAPRLSRLELRKCGISWRSPFLKGLRHLKISDQTTYADARPSLPVWLDALGEMPQLNTLTLNSASPIAPPGVRLPSRVERTITLPSLSSFNISASVRDCGLALAHLVLPALTHLGITAISTFLGDIQSASDVQDAMLHLSQHTHGPQDTQPIRSVFVCSTMSCVNIVAWTDVNPELPSQIPFPYPVPSARVALSVSDMDLSPATHWRVFDAAVTAFPLNDLVTLTTDGSSKFDEHFWLYYAPGWPLLRNVHLEPPAMHGFMLMLLEENGEHERPLLPFLTKLVPVHLGLSARRTLLLCDALMKRVEQGVPLETLDLRQCLATSRAIELLGEIVVEVVTPEETLKNRAQIISKWESGHRGHFVPDPGNIDKSWAHWQVEADDSRYEYGD